MMEKGVIIECKCDNDFSFNRKVTNSCGENFILEDDNIFMISCTDYDCEPIEQYYSICPHCGYMVMINNELLTNSVKKSVRIKCENDCYLFRKNQLISQLIYLERISGNTSVKKRFRSINTN